MHTAPVTIGSWPSDAAIARVGDAPFGIYLHVPFCATRCGYCAFTTTAARSDLDSYRAFVAAANAQLHSLARRLGAAGRAPALSTLYVGGGTPTQLPVPLLGNLISTAIELFPNAAGAEVTVEANPEHLDVDSVRELIGFGVNRLSCGVQSTSGEVLRRLERTHHPDRAIWVVGELAQLRTVRVSADLMIGSPGESDRDVADSLTALLGTGVSHISAYLLGVEDGTRLAHQIAAGTATLPPDDAVATRYRQVDDLLHEHGFYWYEVSNWAKSAADRSAHNLLYWTSADWIGIGPGAHSHVSGERWWTSSSISDFLDGRVRTEGERLDASSIALERVMLGVRLAEGIDPLAHDEFPSLPAIADQLCESGLLHRSPAGRYVLSQDGRLLADAVIRQMVMDGPVRTRRAMPAPPAPPGHQRLRS